MAQQRGLKFPKSLSLSLQSTPRHRDVVLELVAFVGDVTETGQRRGREQRHRLGTIGTRLLCCEKPIIYLSLSFSRERPLRLVSRDTRRDENWAPSSFLHVTKKVVVVESRRRRRFATRCTPARALLFLDVDRCDAGLLVRRGLRRERDDAPAGRRLRLWQGTTVARSDCAGERPRACPKGASRGGHALQEKAHSFGEISRTRYVGFSREPRVLSCVKNSA